jgi:hypothetical protein
LNVSGKVKNAISSVRCVEPTPYVERGEAEYVVESREQAIVRALPGGVARHTPFIRQCEQAPVLRSYTHIGRVDTEAGRYVGPVQHVALCCQPVTLRLLAARSRRRERIC